MSSWEERHARGSDPDTSHDAAKFAARSARTRSMLVALELAHRSVGSAGLTRDEAAAATGFDQYATSKRVSDLIHVGRLADSGRRRAGVKGRQQRVLVWVSPLAGVPAPKPEPVRKPDPGDAIKLLARARRVLDELPPELAKRAEGLRADIDALLIQEAPPK